MPQAPETVYKPRRRSRPICIDCGQAAARVALPYRLDWYRTWCRRMKFRCPHCGATWFIPYP